MTRLPRPTKGITAAFSGRGKTKLYAWFWEHFDNLPAYQRYRVNWQKMVEELEAIGLKGRDDQPLNVDMVRKTYERVRTDRAASQTPPVPPVGPTPKAETPPQPTQPVDPPAPDGPRFQRKTVVLRGSTPKDKS